MLSFGLQYPLATTKAWLNATVLLWCFEQCLFVPLKVAFFAVALPGLIRGKLRRLEHAKSAVGSFPFRTPMRDSAAEYLAARHAHLPIAKFLLGRQGISPSASAAVEQPTQRRHSRAVPLPSAGRLSKLPQIGGSPANGGDGDERTALSDLVGIRARSRRLLRRSFGTTLALFALSLVLFLPAMMQEIVVDQAVAIIVSLVMAVALEVTIIAQLIVAACNNLMHVRGTVALAAPAAAAVAIGAACVIVFARRAARSRRKHRRAEKARLGGAFDTEMYGRREVDTWRWPAARGHTRTDNINTAPFSTVMRAFRSWRSSQVLPL